MDRSNHYESAFEGYLQDQGLCYVAVDETRRSFLGNGPVKSLDFIVLGDTHLCIDVKGRRFPGGPPDRPRHVWECWSTADDIDSLTRWAARLGPDYQGILAFTYLMAPEVELPDAVEGLWHWRGRRYLMRAIDAEAYRQHMRVRSPRWNTVSLRRSDFQRFVQPLSAFTQPRQPDAVDTCGNMVMKIYYPEGIAS
jgi:hypothetical protein